MLIGIQGEAGSNSHMAALEIFGPGLQLTPCTLSAEVFERLDAGEFHAAVLPIENSLHGAVAEHYDLLLQHAATILQETSLRIRHNVIAAPGVRLNQIRRVMSHPVALAQCRRWLRAHPEIEVVPFYDTSGSVKALMEAGARDTAGIAPQLAAWQYGAEVLVAGIEDHAENYTRFYTLGRAAAAAPGPVAADKLSLAMALEHRPGALVEALEVLRLAGLNLTRIESRPVPGRPWEYVFFVDLRFSAAADLEVALGELRGHCRMLKELGRYVGI